MKKIETTTSKHISLLRFGLFTLASLTLSVSVACNGNDTTSNAKTTVISNQPPTSLPMPPLNGKSIAKMGWVLGDGKRTAFGDFKGKVLILDFYATWCEPCRESIPHLVELQARYQNELNVVGLNVGGEDDLERVPAFAEQFKIQYSLGQPDDDLVEFLMADSQAIPQTFVFDRRGLLTKRFIGYGYSTGPEIDQAVATALQSSAE